MPKDKLTQYSATNASNTDVGGVNIDEGCLPSSVNNSIRELMTHLKNFSDATDAIDALAVDNLKLDGNTISSTDTNGNVVIDPNGTGSVGVSDTSPQDTLHVGGTGTTGIKLGTQGSTGRARIFVDSGNDYSLTVDTQNVSDALVIDRTSGRVGIGGTPDDANLKVKTSAVNSLVDNVADEFVIENNGACGMTILSANNDSGFILFGDNDYNAPAGIRYEHANNAFSFRTNSGWDRVRIDSAGRLMMGTSSMSVPFGEAFIVDGNDGKRVLCSRAGTAAREQIVFYNGNGDVGSIDTSGSSTSYNTSSDYRLKEAVVDMTGAIARIKQLAPKRFNFISDPDDTTVDGFLAHEAQTVVPEAVTGTHNEVDDDGNAVMQGIDQGKLVPLLTGALKEAITKIETLETKVAALEAAD